MYVLLKNKLQALLKRSGFALIPMYELGFIAIIFLTAGIF